MIVRWRVLRHQPILVMMCVFLGIGGFWMLTPAGRISLVRNLAWVELSKQAFAEPSGDTVDTSTGVNADFSTVVAAHPTDTRAYLGLGLNYLLAGDADAALTAWREGNVVPAMVYPMIDSYRRNGQWETVFLLYTTLVDFVEMDTRIVDSSPYLLPLLQARIGLACFASKWQLALLSNRETVDGGLCQERLGAIPNLVVNGDFATGDLYGWQRRQQPGFIYEIDMAERDTVDSTTGSTVVNGETIKARISGENRNDWGGLFQTLELPAGTRVRMRMLMRVEAEAGLRVYFLQIRGRGESETWLRTRGPISETTDLREYSAEYRIPSEHRGAIEIYPVFMTGYGHVWIDDFVMEIINE